MREDQHVFNELNAKISEKANYLHHLLMESGVDFATGVPCGVLKHVIKNLDDDNRVLHVPANRESEAVGLAAGAYLAGKKPVVYMQNSGLFAASNDIASLLIPYEMATFFIVSYRGCTGEDAIQHLTTGRMTEALLRLSNLPFTVLEAQDLDFVIGTLFDEMQKRKRPACVLLKKGWHK